MTDVYDVYQEVVSSVNKEENGYLPADLFNTFARAEERHVFNDYNSRLQDPMTAAREKSKLKDRLTPFHISATLATVDGFFLLPEDYAYFSDCRSIFDEGSSVVLLNHYYSQLCEAENDPLIDTVTIQGKIDEILKNPSITNVDLLDATQVANRLQSVIPGKRPTNAKPIMERVDKGCQVYPKDSSSVFLYYYRRPVNAELVMKVDPTTMDETYDITRSRAFEWGEESLTDIVSGIITKFAVYIREKDLFQMNEVTKQTKP